MSIAWQLSGTSSSTLTRSATPQTQASFSVHSAACAADPYELDRPTAITRCAPASAARGAVTPYAPVAASVRMVIPLKSSPVRSTELRIRVQIRLGENPGGTEGSLPKSTVLTSESFRPAVNRRRMGWVGGTACYPVDAG